MADASSEAGFAAAAAGAAEGESEKRTARPTVSALAIATEAGVGRRKTEVILQLFREAGVLHRTRGVYALRAHEAMTPERIEALLKTYTDRGDHDHDRLAEMMHYAESRGCRTQIIRQYFSEPAGELCLRCDNCAADGDLSERVTHPAAEKLAAERPQEPEPPASTAHHEHVTVVQTLHGSYQTTHPETVAHPPASSKFHKGDAVRHVKFGAGKVLDAHDDLVLVAFGREQKRLRMDFLEAA